MDYIFSTQFYKTRKQAKTLEKYVIQIQTSLPLYNYFHCIIKQTFGNKATHYNIRWITEMTFPDKCIQNLSTSIKQYQHLQTSLAWTHGKYSVITTHVCHGLLGQKNFLRICMKHLFGSMSETGMYIQPMK